MKYVRPISYFVAAAGSAWVTAALPLVKQPSISALEWTILIIGSIGGGAAALRAFYDKKS